MTKVRVAMFPNGFKTFTAAESHYLWYTAYADDILYDLKKAVTSKGYGKNGLVYLATEDTWREFKALNTWSDETVTLFEVNDAFFTQRRGSRYVECTVGELPDGYVLVVDPSVKSLYKRVSKNPLKRGLFADFNSVDEMKAVKRGDWKILETGFGVITRGAGACAYIASGASAYVSPTMYAY